MLGSESVRDRLALALALLLTTHGTRHKILYENTAELMARPLDFFFSGGVS